MKDLSQKPKSLLATLLLLLAGVVLLMAMLRQCSDQRPNLLIGSAADTPSGGDTIDVAIDFSPLSYYLVNDTITGFNYELLEMISRSTGIPFKYHPLTSLDDALIGLESGLYDLIAADIPVTLDYRKLLLFTEPVYLDRQVLVQYRDPNKPSSDTLSSQLDLGHKKVWVVANSPSESRLRNLANEIGDTIFIHSNPDYNAELLFLMTSIGEIDYCVINEKTARALSEANGNASISTNISFTQFQAWAMRHDEKQLKDRIDSALQSIKQTDAYESLIEKCLKLQ